MSVSRFLVHIFGEKFYLCFESCFHVVQNFFIRVHKPLEI